jgi:prepilin-type N-terminal cleavage/methylation domain-containing protein
MSAEQPQFTRINGMISQAEARDLELRLDRIQRDHLGLILRCGNLEKQLLATIKERDQLHRWITGKQDIARSISQLINADICRPKGFTLIELLTVVAILAIAFCVIAPAVSRSIRHARASIATTREFHAQRLAAAWDGDCTNEIFSVNSYTQMTNTTELP